MYEFFYNINIVADTFTLCRAVNEEEGDLSRFIDCFYRAADESRIALIKGIPQLGIPAIVELVIPKITIEQNSRALQVAATLTNVSVDGLEKYDLYHFEWVVPNDFFCNY